MSKTYISQAMRTEAEAYFHRRCAYCQSPQALMNVTFEVDHIIPEKEGGQTLSVNLAFACPLCNGHKGAQRWGYDPFSTLTVSLFHPRKQIWSRHFRWSADQQTIEGRPRSGRATVEVLRLNNLNLMRLRNIWIAIGSAPPDWQTPPLIGLSAVH